MKKTVQIIAICMMMAFLSACGSRKEQPGGTLYQICYINDVSTKLVTQEYASASSDTAQLVDELLKQLRIPSEKMLYDTVEKKGFTIMSYSLSEDTLNLDMDERYLQLDTITDVLVRAALVRTFCQIDGIRNVSFTVNGVALTDSAGNAVGPMQAEMFIDNAGDEISPVENITLVIYFANEAGDRLETVNRTLEYNSNISMEKLVLEQLIKGPVGDVGKPTVNPEIKLLSVTTKDGICYVNLDSSFLTKGYEVSPELTIYSIVNSLSELKNINKVQFSVDGETNVMFREKMNLANLYERNLDLLEEAEKN